MYSQATKLIAIDKPFDLVQAHEKLLSLSKLSRITSVRAEHFHLLIAEGKHKKIPSPNLILYTDTENYKNGLFGFG